MVRRTNLVLASSSPRRRDLLAEAGYEFTICAADVEELADATLGAEELVRQNAAIKARAVAPRFPGSIVIGSDTLVALDGAVLGKPRDLEEAFAMISRLVGKTHAVLTGVCLMEAAQDKEHLFVEETKVTFRPLSPAEIHRYLGLINPLDKAGSYAAQEHGDLIIQGTEGSWTNVVGLPMERLAQALAEF